MKRFLFFFTILCFVFAGVGFAKSYTGQIVDSEGKPIEAVSVVTDISGIATITDRDGKFALEFGNESPKFITFSHISYQPKMVNAAHFDRKDISIVLDDAVYPGQNIRVTAMRAQKGLTPVPYFDFTEDDIERDYMVADFPVLLESTPNMYAVSYTGGMVGASDYKIRGFDYKRIGVYINGIPLNDPEDRFTYFYDLPDFSSNVADIQVQRGVGNSLYGDATFGGSINIASAGLEQNRRISLSSGYGRYYSKGDFISEMRKQTVEYSSGLIDGRWSLSGRYSKLYSGGYRDNAWYDGWSYYLSLSRLDDRMSTTMNIYGGPMKAALAFDGIDRVTENIDRRTNWSNYENEIDDFNQPHYELHNAYILSDRLTLRNTLYYIRGIGYYEQYKSDRDITEYNITADDLIDPLDDEIDLVRQKWVAKNQYGWNPRLDWDHKNGSAIFGGSFYYFDSEHWGQVIWAENLSNALDARHRYYEYTGKKYSASLYALDYYSLGEKIRLMGNIQLRYLKYDFDQTEMGALPGYKYDINWLFLSPRVGLTYLVSDRADIYFSFAVASREPSDVTIYDAEDINAFPNLEVLSTETSGSKTFYSFGDPLVESERLYNFEIGGIIRSGKYRAGLNLFWMEFKNEIVPAGGIDDDGKVTVGNADRSVHAGVEFDGTYAPYNYVTIGANAAFNYNRIKDYLFYLDEDWDGEADDTLDYSGNPIAGFPEFLGNVMLDYNKSPFRLTYRLRAVGRQYIENGKNDSLAIDNYLVSSISAAVSLGQITGFGRLTLSGRVDNLFNEKYELSGYAYWNGYWEGEYYPAAERSFFVELKWNLE